MKTSPHKEWIKHLESELEKFEKNLDINILNLIKKLKEEIVEANGFLDPSSKKLLELNEALASKALANKKFNSEKTLVNFMQYLYNLNVLMTIKNSVEIFITMEAFKNISSKIKDRLLKGNIDLKNDVSENFLPFPEIIITMESLKHKGEYQNKFFSVFSNTEKYKEGDKEYNIYSNKICSFVKESDPSCFAELDYIIIPKKIPRLFIKCKKTSDCDKYMETSPTVLKTDEMTGYYCQKTSRTADICNRYIISGTNLTAATTAVMQTLFVSEILKRIKKIPSKRIKEAKEDLNIKKQSISKKIDMGKKEPVIYITDEKCKYIGLKELYYSRKGISHDSPCTHVRSEHFRHLKNGKVVKVKECIVNKDGKKPKYVVKD